MNIAVSRCQACRHSVLSTFASLAGVHIQASPRNRIVSPLASHHPCTVTRRSFASSPRYRQGDELSGSLNQLDSPDSSRASQSKPTESSLPWYLQVETPTPPAPILHRPPMQDIPAIPSDAPPILEPILNHLSTQIGLDNLNLIDLRHLDPPAALGANLIMIIGTARSYKHLNTSADRFCRWLRSRYKLAPYADGLLGRNELKLKLRRKARKMKLAQSVGNTVAVSETDDGITTGWICVNLGTVENARLPASESPEQINSVPDETRTTALQQEELEIEEKEYENPEVADEPDDGYIGFGSRSTAPRIVVQIFTEEKRLEMDLEGLWDHRQQRREQKAQDADAKSQETTGNSAFLETDTVSGPSTSFKPWVQ